MDGTTADDDFTSACVDVVGAFFEAKSDCISLSACLWSMNIPKMTVAAIITTAIKNRSRKNRILKLQKSFIQCFG